MNLFTLAYANFAKWDSTLFLIIGIAAIAIIINAIISSHMELVAIEKGYDKQAHAFWMCFFFGPIGYIYVAMLPDKIKRSQSRSATPHGNPSARQTNSRKTHSLA